MSSIQTHLQKNMIFNLVWNDEELSMWKGYKNPVYTYMLQNFTAMRMSLCSRSRQKKNTMHDLNDESIILTAYKRRIGEKMETLKKTFIPIDIFSVHHKRYLLKIKCIDV